MKISKLFHWLYAVLMFLPLVMFLPSCLYYSLNKYATNETTTQINYKYESNEVNSLDDLVEGNIYYFNISDDTLDSLTNTKTLYFEILSITKYDFSNLSYTFDEMLSSIGNFEGSPKIKFYANNFIGKLEIYLNNTTDYYIDIDLGALDDEPFTFQGVIKLLYQDSIYNDSPGDYFTYTDYNVIESVETNVQDTISNKLYNAWESIWNLPLFAWTKNSFVNAPFTYITGLFGLSSTNSLNYVFTYFVSISICWLVFDLIMYVPNLAHKWIDKGAIE